MIAPPGWRPDLRDRLSTSSSCRQAPSASMRRRPMSGSSGAPRPTARRTMTRSTRSRPATRSRRCREWGKTPKPAEVKIDPAIDMKTPPKIQVDTMPADQYFAYAAELLKLHPPHITDQPILAQMKRLGIEPGKSFDFGKLDPAVQKALETRAAGRPEADGVESPDAGARRQRLVDEHRHHGRLRQLLPEARHRRAARARRQPARGRDLSAQSCRRRRASRSTARTTTRSTSTRATAARRCLLVGHALRQ